MSLHLFANNATGYLDSSISNSATSLTLVTGQGSAFPNPAGGDYFYLTLTDSSNNLEIVKVTARSSDTFTIVRAQQGTSATPFPSGSEAELRVTKSNLDNFTQLSGAQSVSDKTLSNCTIDASTNTITNLNPSTAFSSLVPVANGGTGASTASGARTNLGLGTVSTLDVGLAANNIVQRNASAYIPISSNWTCYESSGTLYFATGGVPKAKLDASGNLVVVGNITAYGTM